MNRTNAEKFFSGVWQWRQKPFFWDIVSDVFRKKIKALVAVDKLNKNGFNLSDDDLVWHFLHLLESGDKNAFETAELVRDHDIGVDDAIDQIEQEIGESRNK